MRYRYRYANPFDESGYIIYDNGEKLCASQVRNRLNRLEKLEMKEESVKKKKLTTREMIEKNFPGCSITLQFGKKDEDKKE